MKKQRIEYLNTAVLVPYARNSRTHSTDQIAQIAASIEEFGFTNPVLIDAGNEIIAGHGRVMAAQRLGMTEVPCIRIAYMTEAQKRAYVIADNQLALNAGWDEELLAQELAWLESESFDLDMLGFDASELDQILDESINKMEGFTDQNDIPEICEEVVSKRGDMWVLGEHTVLCGDSTNKEDVLKIAHPESIDCLITDPPYNVTYVGKTKDALTIENDSMSDAEFRKFLVSAFVNTDMVLKQGAVFYIWHADSEGFNFRGACRDVEWRVRQCLIWVKNVMVLGRQDYQWRHEPCLYGWKGGAAHKWCSDRKQTTILEFNKPSRNGEHPTMKPIELIEYQIRNSTSKGDVVLDLFGGSGSTLIGCERSGRKARIIELDQKYVDVIIRRWQNYTGKVAVHADTGERFPAE